MSNKIKFLLVTILCLILIGAVYSLIRYDSTSRVYDKYNVVSRSAESTSVGYIKSPERKAELRVQNLQKLEELEEEYKQGKIPEDEFLEKRYFIERSLASNVEEALDIAEAYLRTVEPEITEEDLSTRLASARGIYYRARPEESPDFEQESKEAEAARLFEEEREYELLMKIFNEDGTKQDLLYYAQLKRDFLEQLIRDYENGVLSENQEVYRFGEVWNKERAEDNLIGVEEEIEDIEGCIADTALECLQ